MAAKIPAGAKQPGRPAPGRDPSVVASATKSSLVEQVYQTLRRRILDNVYSPGRQALEQELATELGISRTPVREALMRLQNEGLIEVIPRHGMRVLPVSPTDMAEIYVVLTALECAAAEIVAARRPTEAELEPLLRATSDMDRALRSDDLDAWAAADERFHRTLVDLAGNRMLRETVDNFWDRAHRARMVTLRLRPKPVNSTREHTALVARLRAGDAPGAVDVNRAHRGRASRELLSLFERMPLQEL